MKQGATWQMQNRERKHTFSCTASQGTNVTVSMYTFPSYVGGHYRFIEIYVFHIFHSRLFTSKGILRIHKMPPALTELSWKLSQFVEHCTGITEVVCSNPVQGWNFRCCFLCNDVLSFSSELSKSTLCYQPFNRCRFSRNVILSSFCDCNRKTKTVQCYDDPNQEKISSDHEACLIPIRLFSLLIMRHHNTLT